MFEQPVGSRAGARNVELTNLGNEPLRLDEVAVVNPTGSTSTWFEVDAASCAAGIPAMGACTLGIEFRPQTIGQHDASLKITPAGSAPMFVALTATATR